MKLLSNIGRKGPFNNSDNEIQIGRGAPAWMVTYSDLITQLLIFFVMMFALAATLNEIQLRQIKKRLEKYTYENKLEDVIYLEINPKGLLISLNEKLMFDSGKADIYEEAKNILSDISREIIDVPNNVRIEGHTDSVPIKTAKFPSNWELSTTRATNIARYLIETLNFPPARISAGGYSKYHPAVRTEIDNIIIDYKIRVREVPKHFIRELSKAKSDEEKELVHSDIRSEQLKIQMEMQEVLEKQLKSANENSRRRALNRRVDIIVQRLGNSVDRKNTDDIKKTN